MIELTVLSLLVRGSGYTQKSKKSLSCTKIILDICWLWQWYRSTGDVEDSQRKVIEFSTFEFPAVVAKGTKKIVESIFDVVGSRPIKKNFYAMFQILAGCFSKESFWRCNANYMAKDYECTNEATLRHTNVTTLRTRIHLKL